MARKSAASKESPMELVNVNARVTMQTADLLQLAKLMLRKSVREVVQEAIDSYLKAHGVTPDKLPSAGKPRH
jgi:hypothetical protein